jgi:hypothetical protein
MTAMKRFPPRLAATPVVIALTGWSSSARALGPVEVELASAVGYATSPVTAGPNPLGFGWGGRIGGSAAGVYVGAKALFYAGGTASAGTQSQSEHGSTIGAEAGYGVKFIDRITVRGLVGIGQFEQNGSGPAVGGKDNLYVEPSVTGLFAFGPLFAGANVGVLLVPSAVASTYAALTVRVELGVSF